MTWECESFEKDSKCNEVYIAGLRMVGKHIFLLYIGMQSHVHIST